MNDRLLLPMMLGGAKYGYQLKREAGLITLQALHNNLVYPSLRRFLEEGRVSKKSVPGERGQTRQQYALSAEGRRHLFERVSQFGETEASSEAAFSFAGRTIPGAQAGDPREESRAAGELLQNRDKNLATLQSNLDWGKLGGEIVRYRRKQVEMELDWVRRLRRIAIAVDRRRGRRPEREQA